MKDDIRQAALAYHSFPTPGKISIEPTKALATQRDLSLAYSPGVAAACEAIVEDPEAARLYTARGNLVAVVTNGTAVLGLGAIGPLAGKPVMEGKAVLFKKFAGIDVFDIEVDAADPELFVKVVAALEPTFGGINLEDIKAPECFAIEQALRQRMAIPVFHDDQHGTAIVCAAAVRNALLLQGKSLASARLVTSGAGAAALACVDLLVSMGLPQENVILTDIKGVVYQGRERDMPPNMARYAIRTNARTLKEVLRGADIFLGLSAPQVLDPEWLDQFAPNPVILAMSNPDPEIRPELVWARRPDAIVATGRSDYPNQVNNVLCFPYIFRGALDVGASEINEAMKVAAAEAIASLARIEVSESVVDAYGGVAPRFGHAYIIPAPFDPRLILTVAPAVARAAMDSGVARRPIADFEAYRAELERFVYRSGQLMQPVFAHLRGRQARLVYGEGEDERVLRAVQSVVDDGLAQPILVGRQEVIAKKIAALNLRLTLGETVQVLDPAESGASLLAEYRLIAGRRGATPADAERTFRESGSLAAAMLLRSGGADSAVVGGDADWWRTFTSILPIIPQRDDVTRIYSTSVLILPKGPLFFADTHVNAEPTAKELVELTQLAAQEVRRFGMTPKVALLSHSNFGASRSASARRMREALRLIRAASPELLVDGEMHGDAALSQSVRDRLVMDSPLEGSANLLILPSLDAANIALTLMVGAADGLVVGPVLLGMSKPIHVLTPSATARDVINLSALAAAQCTSRGPAAPPNPPSPNPPRPAATPIVTPLLHGRGRPSARGF